MKLLLTPNLVKALCWLFSSLGFFTIASAQQSAADFQWPEGKKMALSLSWDDARLSNVDVCTPLLDKYGVKATFYVVPSAVEQRLDGWKKAVESGHEIANHTLVHPCTGNFSWSRDKALEDYTLASMRQELLTANARIKELLGVEPVSFAYTCGNTFVGKGLKTQSYIPLIAEMFESGRGWMNEAPNDPIFADLANLQGIEMDGKDFDEHIKPLIDQSMENGSWLLLAGHEIGEDGRQTTRIAMLEKLIAYAQKPESGIWLAPVGTITDYIQKQRVKSMTRLKKSLSFYASFDHGYHADFARGDKHIYTAPAYDDLENATIGMSNKDISLLKNQGKSGHALSFAEKSKPVIFFQSNDNIAYKKQNWSGTISLWLQVDPENELAPGYTDPIQITDVGYNDAALWVDFSNQNPRSFRMGVYGDLSVWNPENIPPDKNPAFNERLLAAKNRPFGKDVWTHVVVVFSSLNSKNATASFYMNGIHQGDREITEPFSWELEKSKIFLGLNYKGRMDEVLLFDRALDETEVKMIRQLPEGGHTLLQANE